MKRIKRRSSAALLLAVLLLCGAVTLCARLWRDGDDWAAYAVSSGIYTRQGVLAGGTLTDRNGVLLAKAEDGEYEYAEDVNVRVASLHTVGDYRGFIGTSALTAFASRLVDYDPVYGQGAGRTVALSLSAELQSLAWRELGGRPGAVLVMNTETGEILCMVSSPSYDPYEDPDVTIDGLFLNRCLNAAFVPGSIFKLVTAAAALENIPDVRSRSFTCTGKTEVAGVKITCAAAHGKQTLGQALANSCNCTFAKLSLELGGDTIKAYADKLGLNESLSLDGISTAAGHIEAVQEQDSYLAWSGIGQHTDLVCPYAMLRYAAALSSHGVVREPTLLLGGDNGSTRLLSGETADGVASMMKGYTDVFKKISVAAKTGTAERGDGTSNAWLVGFLKDAPLAFVVLVEHGGEGYSVAGPIANRVMTEALSLWKAEQTE